MTTTLELQERLNRRQVAIVDATKTSWYMDRGRTILIVSELLACLLEDTTNPIARSLAVNHLNKLVNDVPLTVEDLWPTAQDKPQGA